MSKTLKLCLIGLLINQSCYAFSWFNYKTEDYCLSLANSTWLTSATTSGGLNCTYSGSGIVKGQFPSYKINVTATKVAGGPFCPQSVAESIPFGCTNNVITVHNGFANLRAVFANKSTLKINGQITIFNMSANLTGTANRTN